MFAQYLVGHGGTNPIVSQTALTVVIVVVGMSMIAFAFGRMKNADALKMHRAVMSASILILLAPVFLVMLPATFNFYTDPDVQVFSTLSFLTIIHGIVGFPVVVLGLIFVANDLPKNTRKWMRSTSLLMLATVAIGVFMFFVMLDIITIMPM